MAALRIREGERRYKPARLGGIVVRDRRFEVFALRRRLPELPPEPTQEADGRLVGHSCRLTAAVEAGILQLGLRARLVFIGRALVRRRSLR